MPMPRLQTNRLIRHLIRFWLALALCQAVFTAPASGGGGFDTDDELLLEADIVLPEPADDDEKKNTALDRFLEGSTFTLGYSLSLGTDAPQKVIDNRAFLRMEQGSLLGDTLFFKLDAKTAFLLKNDHQAEARNRDFHADGSIRELYLQPGFETFTLTFGKQISVWGKADTVAVTDVLSPRDFSQFVFVELEDARFGQWMAAANIYDDLFNTFVFFTPYPGRDREPDNGSRYHRPLPDEDRFAVHQDRIEFGDLEYGFKLDKSVSKTDTSLMAGRFRTNAALFNHTGAFEGTKPVLEKTWPGYYMAGAAVTHARQAFLFKLELAYKNGLPLQGLTPQGIYMFDKKEVIDSAAGIEYNANSQYQVSLELSNRYIASGTADLLPGTDENSSALYTTFFKDFFNQTLEFEYIFFHHIQEKNQFHKFRLTYDLTDTIQLKAEYGVFNIKDTASLMYPYKDEDRIGFEIRYFF